MVNKKYGILLCFLCIVFPLFAQEESPDTIPDDGSDLEQDSQTTLSAPDPDLQRNFTIIDTVHDYDLNPHTAAYSSEAQILGSVYEGLYSYDPATLDPVPALAESYKLSRDKLRWTFTIRKGATFSDGEPITASVFRNSWLTLLKTPDAPYASLLDCVSGAAAYRSGKGSADDVGITVRNDSTLVVELATPAAHLPRVLCHHAFSAVSEKDNVYSGPFIIQERTKDKLVLTRNNAYWDKKDVYLPQITILQSNDAAENAWQFNAGTADWVSASVDTDKLLSKESIRIAAEFGTEYLFFSCKNAPWNNAAFRNALMAAVPWKELRANSLVPASTFVYPLTGYPAVDGLTDTDPDEALELMNKARKAAGIKADEKLTITFGISDSDRMKQEAELLKAAWAPLGVTLLVQVTPEDRYLNSIGGWNADLFSYSWIGDFADPLAFLELFREGSTLNQSAWQNDTFTKLLNQADATTDMEEHYKLLSQAEETLLDDGVVLPISHPVCLHAIDLRTVGGWTTNALDIHPFKYMYIKANTSVPGNLVLTMK